MSDTIHGMRAKKTEDILFIASMEINRELLINSCTVALVPLFKASNTIIILQQIALLLLTLISSQRKLA